MLSGIPSLKTFLHHQGIKLAVVRLLSCRPQNLPLLLVWWRFMPDAQHKDWVSKSNSQQRQRVWMPCRRRSGRSSSKRLESLVMWVLNSIFFSYSGWSYSQIFSWRSLHCLIVLGQDHIVFVILGQYCWVLKDLFLLRNNKSNKKTFYVCECVFDGEFPSVRCEYYWLRNCLRPVIG